jgi:hypothetical protein
VSAGGPRARPRRRTGVVRRYPLVCRNTAVSSSQRVPQATDEHPLLYQANNTDDEHAPTMADHRCHDVDTLMMFERSPDDGLAPSVAGWRRLGPAGRTRLNQEPGSSSSMCCLHTLPGGSGIAGVHSAGPAARGRLAAARRRNSIHSESESGIQSFAFWHGYPTCSLAVRIIWIALCSKAVTRLNTSP